VLRHALLGLTLATLLAPAALAQQNTGVPEGFVPLFNGQDLTGWAVMGASVWQVQDGVIHCTGQGSGWLRSEKEYGDLILRIEYRIYPKGNSGIFVHAPMQGRASAIGMECQVLDDFGRQPNVGTAGAFYGVQAPAKNVSKPAGEWNQVEITWIGDHITTVMNGEKLYDVDLMDEALNASLPEGRKASARLRRGYLGLQKHTGPVDFRNIYLRDLEQVKPAGQ